MADSDSYWYESDASRNSTFNFDDTDDNVGSSMCGVSLEGTAKLFHEMQRDNVNDDHSFLVTDTKTKVPLSKLVSEKTLEMMLDADSDIDPLVMAHPGTPVQEEVKILRRQIADRWIAPDVNVTITKILLGKPFSLHLYRSLEQKKSLLDAAVNIGDGDAILAVVVFLSKTLKKSLFNRTLMNNTVAANHYIDYLTTRMQIQEVTDLLTMLGRSREASMKQFEMGCRNPQRRVQRLTNCLQNHFHDNVNDRHHVEKFIKLLEWQQMAKMETGSGNRGNESDSLSAVNCLCYACENHWSEPQGSPLSPHTLAQQHGISDKQFQWAVLLVRGKVKHWDDIDNLFIAKKWLGGRKLKALLPMEQIVMQLHSLEAPNSVLMSYLSLIDNLDQRLKIARAVSCNEAIIDIYVAQRDRLALLNCKAFLEPQSGEYLYAEAKLNSSTIRWRN